MEIYVYGLGHVGLPLACWIALSGKKVFGIDIDAKVIDDIKNGKITIEENYHDTHIKTLAQALVFEDKLILNTALTRLSPEPAVFLISVGLADRPDGSKDLSPILAVIDEIGRALVPQDLIILRSTMTPGICQNVIAPRLEQFNISFHLAYCPETIIETKAFAELEDNPLILSGIDEESYRLAEAFMRSISSNHIYRASNMQTAEMAKVVQNIYRDVNIAFANEIRDAADHLNIDFDELQALVNVNPRVALHNAGPGVGGYCLPNALCYLQGAFEDREDLLPLAKTARALNRHQPEKIVRQATNALAAIGKKPDEASVAVVGLAMKSYCADLRFSPALEIIEILQRNKVKVRAFDPMIPTVYPFQASSFEACIDGADCLIITAKQRGLDFNRADIAARMAPSPIIIDTQSAISKFC